MRKKGSGEWGVGPCGSHRRVPLPTPHSLMAVLLLVVFPGAVAGQRPTYQQQMQDNQHRLEGIRRERSEVEQEPRQLLLDFGALSADALETMLIVLHLLLVGRALAGDGSRENYQEQNGHKGVGSREWYSTVRAAGSHSPLPTPLFSHTRFKCLPTLIALPKRPMSAPNPTIAAACSLVKKADCRRYLLIHR